MRLVDMKRLIPILCVTLSLTACSGPDSSGGVALSKDPYPTNAEFPHGDCDDDPTFAETNTGCGWIHVNDQSFYIKPGADLRGADLSLARLRGVDLIGATLGNSNLTDAMLIYVDLYGAYLHSANLSRADLTGANLRGADLTDANLSGADLIYANLSRADLSGADLSGAKGNSSTVCPNGKFWGTAGNNCGF